MKTVQLGQLSAREQKEAQNEVSILRQLNHPNIVRYVDSFTTGRAQRAGPALCIIMEYADGGDLAKYLKDRRGALLREGDIMPLFLQLCLALKHLHDRRILHRDLKTQNIFLTAHRTRPVVKLGDFGISTTLQSSLALAKTVCGTPYYFSPELCQNKPYNNKSDVWSAGCVLYELCTLRHAFDGASMQALMGRIVKGQYKPLPQTLTASLRSLVAAMLQRSVHSRPSVNRILSLDWVQACVQTLLDAQQRQPPPPPPPAAAPGGEQAPPPSGAVGGAKLEAKHLQEQAAKQKRDIEKRMAAAVARERQDQARRQAAAAAAAAEQRQRRGCGGGGVVVAADAEADKAREERAKRRRREAAEAQRRRQLQLQQQQRAPAPPTGRDGWSKVDEHVAGLRRQLDGGNDNGGGGGGGGRFAQIKGLPLMDPAAAAFLEARLEAQMNRHKPCNPFAAASQRERQHAAHAEGLVKRYGGGGGGGGGTPNHLRQQQQQRHPPPPSPPPLQQPPCSPPATRGFNLDTALQGFEGGRCGGGGGGGGGESAEELWRQRQIAIERQRRSEREDAAAAAAAAAAQEPLPPQRLPREDEGDDPSQCLWNARPQAFEEGLRAPPPPPPPLPAPVASASGSPLRHDDLPAAAKDRRRLGGVESGGAPDATEYADVLARLRRNVLGAPGLSCGAEDDDGAGEYFEEASQDAPLPQQQQRQERRRQEGDGRAQLHTGAAAPFVAHACGLAEREAAIRKRLEGTLGTELFGAAYAAMCSGDDRRAYELLVDHQAVLPLFSQLLYCVASCQG